MTNPEYHAAYIPASAELIQDTAGGNLGEAIVGMLDGTWTPPPPKPEPPTPAWHLALLAATDGVLRAVVEHHGPRWEFGSWVCLGCDIGAYAADNPAWPCSTIDLIAEKLDIGPEQEPS